MKEIQRVQKLWANRLDQKIAELDLTTVQVIRLKAEIEHIQMFLSSMEDNRKKVKKLSKKPEIVKQTNDPQVQNDGKQM